MTPSPASLRRAAARMSAAVACAGLIGMAAGCGGSTSAPATALRPAAAFLGTYARADGRVVRLDQGGDTVSEGQAYGLLLAQAAGNHRVFQRIWGWTHAHLQLPDGLFAWHANASGQVIGREPASDADLLIAWALLRSNGPGAAIWHRDGRRVAAAILGHETTTGPGGMPILAAGPWATGRPASLDPSYWALTAMRGLAQLTGQPEWSRLAAGAVTLTRRLTHDGKILPPDWAELTASGTLRPEAAPGGGQSQPQFGPDAQRTVVWFAASCSPPARALAARWWPLLRGGARRQALALRTDGAVLNGTPAPLPLVAAAASARAAGDPAMTRTLLHQAVSMQRRHPTYYGGAWDALGPTLLTTENLGRC